MNTTVTRELVEDWQSLLTDAMEDSQTERLARLRVGDGFLEGCHRASLWLAATIGSHGVIAVTSVRSTDGRPSVAAGLARAFVSNVSGRVIVADLNFGRGEQSELFGVALRPGLGECLAYGSSPRLVLAEPSRLWLLPAGGRGPFTRNRLIDIMAAGRLLEALRGLFTVVVLDLPPLAEAPEAVRRLNDIVDGYVLVGRYRGTHVGALRAAADRLAESRHPVALVMAHDRSRIPRWVGKFLDWTSASATARTSATTPISD